MAPSEDKTEPLNPEVQSPETAPESTRMVWVTAPSTLPAGYTFDAQVEGHSDRFFSVEVPEGGVTEGQTFLAPMPRHRSKHHRHRRQHINAPKGRWKDGLFDCCKYGPCHASLWCAICCPYLLMAQVMTRMRLTWRGEYGRGANTRGTFKKVLYLVLGYIAFCLVLLLIDLAITPNNYFNVSQYIPSKIRKVTHGYVPMLRAVGAIFFGLWALYALCMTRESVRVRYSIRQSQRYCGCEDLYCAMCCTCCTVAQLARHTGEYEKYPAVCCSKTGLPEDAPLV